MTGGGKRGWPPRGLGGWLARRAVGGEADPSNGDTRKRLGELEGWVSTALNVALASLKGATGWLTGSISLIADAVNNLTDVGSSLVIAISFKWARVPRDREHPFGHGRAESVATLVLAMTLIAVGLDLAKEGIHRLIYPAPLTAPVWVIVAIVLTIGAKLWLAHFARRLARVTESQVLEADAWNHTFDVLSTCTVIVALVSARLGWGGVDGWAAVFVSLFILYTGAKYARAAVHVLLGAAPDKEELRRIRAIVKDVAGVDDVHDVMVHRYGDVCIVSLHVEVAADATALAVHDLAESVEDAVARATGGKVIVHVDPVDRRHPVYDRARHLLRAAVERDPRLVEFHDLRLAGEGEGIDLSADLVVRTDVAAETFDAIRTAVRDALQSALPAIRRLDLGIEAEFSGEPIRRHVFTPKA